MLAPVLFPPTCIGCRRLLAIEHDRSLPLCSLCRPDHEPLPSDRVCIDDIEACFAYAGPWILAIAAFKFQGDLALAGPLGRVLSAAPILRREHWDAVVPVPLHPRRLWSRGFNQSEMLCRAARRIAQAGGGDHPPVRRVLSRQRATASQVELPVAERARNVEGAFRPRRDVSGLRLLVVDDVTTTGATLRSCITTLRRAGAERVAGLALLRTLA